MRVDFERSVNLLSMAVFPELLASEALAILTASEVADAAAIIVRSIASKRCTAAVGWDSDMALAAAEQANEVFVIVCGERMGEKWEVVAELKPGLAEGTTAEAIRRLVETAASLERFRREEAAHRFRQTGDGGLWRSDRAVESLSEVIRIASLKVPVLITGEPGTGKELMAREIHRLSGRGGEPFCKFDCASVPRDMHEARLLGSSEDAIEATPAAFDGLLLTATKGTVFLDRIEELDSSVQVGLLRFLETRQVCRVGGAEPAEIDVLIVASSSADPSQLAESGDFHRDLLARLSVGRLHLPPLRERREEIPSLIDHYLRKFGDEHKRGHLTLDDEALEYLVLFAWPGNIRQLVNELNRLVALAEPDSLITAAALAPEIQASRRTVRVETGDEPEVRVRLDQPLGDAVDAIERVMITRALERSHGNYENAAKLLGISRKGLFLKRRRWGMRRAS